MEFLDFLKELYHSDHFKYIIVPLGFSVIYYFVKEGILGVEDKNPSNYNNPLEKLTKNKSL